MPVSLKKNISYGLIGNIIYAVTQWVILSIFNKIGSPEITGQYAIALSISAPLMILGQMGLRQTLATDAEYKYDFMNYYWARFVTSFICFIMAIILSIVFYSYEVAIVTLSVSVAKFIENMSDIIYGFNQKKEEIKKIAVSKIARGVSSLIAIIIVFYITKNLALAVLSQAVTWLLIYFILDHVKINLAHLDIKSLRSIMMLSYPLAITSMLISLNTNIPRYFIEKELGLYDLGVFVSLTYLITAGGLVIQAIGQAISPRLSKYYYNKDFTAFKILLFKSILLVIVLCCIAISVNYLFGEALLNIIYGSDLARYSNLFLMVIVFGTMLYITTILGYALTAARVLKVQPAIFLTCIMVSLVFSFILIEKHHLYGATVSWGLSIITGLIFNSIFLYRVFKK